MLRHSVIKVNTDKSQKSWASSKEVTQFRARVVESIDFGLRQTGLGQRPAENLLYLCILRSCRHRHCSNQNKESRRITHTEANLKSKATICCPYLKNGARESNDYGNQYAAQDTASINQWHLFLLNNNGRAKTVFKKTIRNDDRRQRQKKGRGLIKYIHRTQNNKYFDVIELLKCGRCSMRHRYGNTFPTIVVDCLNESEQECQRSAVNQ